MSLNSSHGAPATAERPHTHEMVVVHRVFRRESALLPRLVRAVPDGDTARAALVLGALRDYTMGLHHHHHAEDELIWPLLRARAARDEALVDRMTEQHEAIDRTLAAVAEWTPVWERSADRISGEELALALEAHRTALLVHLDEEETSLLPLVAEHLTVAEWDLVGERGLEGLPKNKRLLALGAILEEATPEESAFFLGKAPLVGRLLWRAVGRRQYAAYRDRMRAPLAGE
ncbi:hemerythrin domain-containing protein [Streptomyces arenae]|uniref:hemerythrin domain-containing protein n=1 Tax=Streptomyces arenae TaxID=29301 RepID=UPI00265B6FE1|nr:hemerythrin domain-containing protein [Streptomyces arenae]MCG7203246.1 hemerythrin domain-containing protein [Streptomyces arenae]